MLNSGSVGSLLNAHTAYRELTMRINSDSSVNNTQNISVDFEIVGPCKHCQSVDTQGAERAWRICGAQQVLCERALPQLPARVVR